jgi:hypothetical protein
MNHRNPKQDRWEKGAESVQEFRHHGLQGEACEVGKGRAAIDKMYANYRPKPQIQTPVRVMREDGVWVTMTAEEYKRMKVTR